MVIDSSLVRELLRSQFPQWAGLDIRAVPNPGWDNRSFRLGDDLVVRLPSQAAYAPQVEKEHHWLPLLAPQLPLTVPTIVAMGLPTATYPWSWSIRRWIDGQSPVSSTTLATGLAGFLQALQRVDASDGPAAGKHNFHRGGDLLVYDKEVVDALAKVGDAIDHSAAQRVWEEGRRSRWRSAPVWIHGDVSPGNLLMRSERLVAVIDFGNLGVGDPACDLAIAWSWFDDDAHAAFRSALPLDEETWLRGRAWALWKALIVAAGMTKTNAVEYADPARVIARCIR
jgi:aminoglycoside phosphotransferase (APT) family kinase protein